MKRRDFIIGAAAMFATAALPTGNVLAAAKANGKLGIIKGPTPIDQGMAISEKDFTIYNDKIAASFAVGTNNYWNMTGGSILDIAIIQNGKFGTDLVNDVEFLNDLWTASGSYNNENLLHPTQNDITWNQDSSKITVTAKTRYWKNGHKLPLNVTITYTLEAGKNYISLSTTVENPAGNDPYKNMYSGYSISTLAANMFGPFGYYPDLKITGVGIGADKDVNEKFGNFVVTYGKDYAVALQLDGANTYKGSSGYKDLYTLRTIEPGKSYMYTGEIIVLDKGETSPILERYLEKDSSIPSALVQGEVKDSNGKPVANAFIIVSKKGNYKETVKSHGTETLKKDILQPLVWKMADSKGKYSMRLPKGDYSMHVEAMGYTPADSQKISLNNDQVINFMVKDGAKAVFKVTDEKDNPLYAKVSVSGITSTVKTLGGTVFFSDPKTYEIAFDIAAPEKEVTFTVSCGADFETLPIIVKKLIKPREKITETIIIPTLIQTNSKKWYSADIHEHSDIGDGATPITELHKAQLAAGLNLHAISDHDSITNNAALDKLAKTTGRPFLSSLEVSPGWGHWGILGMDYTKTPISPNLTPAQIIKAGHDMNALVVMNHPYTDYGFLNNRSGVKGGYDPGSDDFDLIEIQSTIDLTNPKNMDKKALDAAMDYWNKGKKIYLVSGSDQHDVTSVLYPGIIRTYAYIEGQLSSRKFMDSLKAGSSYVTMGPIIIPSSDSIFGSAKMVEPGKEISLNFEIQAVNGLKNVTLWSEGKTIEEVVLDNIKNTFNFKVQLKPEKDTWYNIVAIDSKGGYAVTNPIWINIKK